MKKLLLVPLLLIACILLTSCKPQNQAPGRDTDDSDKNYATVIGGLYD